MVLGVRLALLFLLLIVQTDRVFSEEIQVDVEIVLAVDASGSVDKKELQLQLDGIALAFRDKTVQRAMTSGPHHRIGVSMLVWSDASFPKFPTQWYLIDSSTSAEAFASAVASFREASMGFSAIGGGGTGLGDALGYAVNMMKNNNFAGSRRIVDISGDGKETPPWNDGAIMLPEARVIASTQNITVNGLAVVIENHALTAWYRHNVIVGFGSFVIEAKNYHDFAYAMKKKLLREFSNSLISLKTPVQ